MSQNTKEEIEPLTLAGCMLSIVVLCDVLCALVMLIAYFISKAGAGNEWMDYALWRLLPCSLLLNLLYLIGRVVKRYGFTEKGRSTVKSH